MEVRWRRERTPRSRGAVRETRHCALDMESFWKSALGDSVAPCGHVLHLLVTMGKRNARMHKSARGKTKRNYNQPDTLSRKTNRELGLNFLPKKKRSARPVTTWPLHAAQGHLTARADGGIQERVLCTCCPPVMGNCRTQELKREGHGAILGVCTCGSS